MLSWSRCRSQACGRGCHRYCNGIDVVSIRHDVCRRRRVDFDSTRSHRCCQRRVVVDVVIVWAHPRRRRLTSSAVTPAVKILSPRPCQRRFCWLNERVQSCPPVNWRSVGVTIVVLVVPFVVDCVASAARGHERLDTLRTTREVHDVHKYVERAQQPEAQAILTGLTVC